MMRPWGLNRRLPSLPNLPLMGALEWTPVPPPELLRSFALTSPDTGAAWVTPDGLMLVTMMEAVDA